MKIRSKNISKLLFLAAICCPDNSYAQQTFSQERIDVGADTVMTVATSTAAASVIKSDDVNRRAGKNVATSVVGEGLGIFSRLNAGTFYEQMAVMQVRGLQTLNDNNDALILVDGIERELTNVTADEVESVTILKDAAAVALYGYKGINGAILVKTKRGKYNSSEVKFSIDHQYNWLTNKPSFVDAYTYANAINEARANDGLTARYTQDEVYAFKSGAYPYMYPNVNWLKETFRNHGVTNKYALQFSGGGDMFRYYTMASLITDKGFVNNSKANDGYSTQDKYVRGNLRTNLDIDLTTTTKLQVNLMGALGETNAPGDGTSLWYLLYSIPSAAMPIINEDGTWGGNATWDGTLNPVAQATGAGYTRYHEKTLYADMTISQDLSALLKGLKAKARVAYDNESIITEDHSMTYAYSQQIPGEWTNGEPTVASTYTGGQASTLGQSASISAFQRALHTDVGLSYSGVFGKHSLYTQLKWDFEFSDYYEANSTIYRQNFSWWTHYDYGHKYIAELALVESGTNRLAPGHKWAFSPTLSLAWVLSNEKFLKDNSVINFLKLRASVGLINADFLPSSSWNYYKQAYDVNGTSYAFSSVYTSDFGAATLGRIATTNSSREKGYKYNFGIDATILKGLDIQLEGFFQRRSGIWVDASGKYSSLIGFTAPYENGGKVDSYGFEASLDYNKQWGDFTLNIGGTFNFNGNKIKEMYEEPRAYSNLVKTGNSVGQYYGLKAIGLFQSEEEIASSPTQSYGTVVPGDIKYEDVNDDGVINDNDICAIGYGSTPQIYYNLHLGAEYKGFGLYMMCQGTGRYSAIMSTKSLYWPLTGNTTISQYAYDNRWTATNPNATMPRLSYSSNNNNYQTSSWWLRNRSYLKLRNIELYYRLPQSLLAKTKILNAAKVYLRGIDLFCFDHIDEVDAEAWGVAQPLTRSFDMGVSLTF